MNSLRKAATVIVCRYKNRIIEVLMVKRSRKMAFFPNAWVFPGGRLDDADDGFPSTGNIAGLADKSYAVAAIRECYEESGVWLGSGTPSAELRQRLNRREVTLPNDGTLIANLDRMALWSWWITPLSEPKRYDTKFFLTCLRPDEKPDVYQDGIETVDYCWVAPSRAVWRHQHEDFFLAPPTYLTLRELSQFDDLENLFSYALARQVLPIQPVHRKDDGKLTILLPNHPDHPDEKPVLETNSVVLREYRWHLD